MTEKLEGSKQENIFSVAWEARLRPQIRKEPCYITLHIPSQRQPSLVLHFPLHSLFTLFFPTSSICSPCLQIGNHQNTTDNTSSQQPNKPKRPKWPPLNYSLRNSCFIYLLLATPLEIFAPSFQRLQLVFASSLKTESTAFYHFLKARLALAIIVRFSPFLMSYRLLLTEVMTLYFPSRATDRETTLPWPSTLPRPSTLSSRFSTTTFPHNHSGTLVTARAWPPYADSTTTYPALSIYISLTPLSFSWLLAAVPRPPSLLSQLPWHPCQSRKEADFNEHSCAMSSTRERSLMTHISSR